MKFRIRIPSLMRRNILGQTITQNSEFKQEHLKSARKTT